MEERNILSREEVDAIIKSAQSADSMESSDEAEAAQGILIRMHYRILLSMCGRC